jgi:hypothetical protein
MGLTRRLRASGPLVAAWAVLVTCRVVARLVSVGSGQRGPMGLALLTASVNAYWLVAATGVIALRHAPIVRRSARHRILILATAALASLLAEPVWYRVVLIAFHGRPMAWTDAVVSRGDVNLCIVALILVASRVADGFNAAVARQRQRGELEAVLADAQLRALTLQLQPHFLFNTLQVAAEAAFDDIGEAKDIVRDLQALLRRSFELEERSVVRVKEEVDFLHSYVAIQRQRFGSRLSVELDIDVAAMDLLLPPLLLQPLVENSIRHGIGAYARNGRVIVRVALVEQALRIDVRDNGIGYSAATRSVAADGLGIGLGVTRRRLNALFPNEHQLLVADAPEGGTAVAITIPAMTDASRVVEAMSARVTGDEAELGPRWWSGPARVAAALGAVLVLVNGIGGSWFDARAARAGDSLEAGSIAMWFPLQLVAVALAVVLWRARDVRRWLERRDAETRALEAQIVSTRARIETLRSGKDVMLLALSRLTSASDALDFDALVLVSSAMIRSLLAVVDERSSVEVEAMLAALKVAHV